MGTDVELRRHVLAFQRNEITEHHIYHALARSIKSGENRRILEKIAGDELRHSHEWKRYSGQDVPPNRLRVGFYYLIGRVLGFTFAIKLMERGEENAAESYSKLEGQLDGLDDLIRDENEHEAGLSLGVAAFSFIIGYIFRTLLGVEA
jgi:rubrerythrin